MHDNASAGQAGRAAVNGGTDQPGSLCDEVRSLFADRQWGFHERGDLPALISELSGPLGRWVLLVQVDERGRTIVFYSVLPVSVREQHRPAMAQFLTRVNYGLSLGCFELDYADGEVRTRIALPVGDEPLAGDLVERCIRVSGRLTEVYLPFIEAVAAGDEPGPEVPLSPVVRS